MSDKPEWGTQEWHRLHPIYLSVEDMKKSKEELIAEIRSTLTKLRGQLNDIAHGFGWADRLDTPQHGITLVISNLYHVLLEMEQTTAHHKKNEEISKFAKEMPPGGI